MKVKFIVPGEPKGKQRPRVVNRGKFSTAYTPKQTVIYENLVKYSYQEQVGMVQLEPPIAASIIGYFPIPKSVSKKKHALMADGWVLHTHKVDADNLAKIILDSLNKIAYQDDAGVSALRVVKKYSDNPRVEVELEEIREDGGQNQ